MDLEKRPLATGRGTDALIFLHIPKTAGQTIIHVLKRQYAPEATHAKRPGDVMDELSELREDARGRIRLLYGHMAFGAHRLLRHPARYLAFVRDPIERAVSHYHYVRTTPEHRLYDRVRRGDMSLHDYVGSSISNELDNGQTALIAGRPIARPSDFFEPELLEIAKQNIDEHFGLVGVTERFDESLLLAKDVFGWTRRTYYRPINVAPEPASKAEVPKETLRLIEDRNRLDLELHRFARELLDAEIARRGPPFRRRVTTFRVLNAGLGWIGG